MREQSIDFQDYGVSDIVDAPSLKRAAHDFAADAERRSAIEAAPAAKMFKGWHDGSDPLITESQVGTPLTS
jgi:hypothetical protein